MRFFQNLLSATGGVTITSMAILFVLSLASLVVMIGSMSILSLFSFISG